MKTLYVGVFLTPESREKLLAAFPPVHEDVHADHLTIVFKPTELEISNIPLGKRVRLQVLHVVRDSRGQAALVGGVISMNKHPHITISVAKGTKPVYSNTMFEQDCISIPTPAKQEPSEPLFLDGVIDSFPRAGENQGDQDG